MTTTLATRSSIDDNGHAGFDPRRAGTHAPAVLSRPLAVFDKEALLKGPAVEHGTDLLTYRVPLKTLPNPDRGGDGH